MNPNRRPEGDPLPPPRVPDRENGQALIANVTASNSQAALAAELARTRAALRELYRVFVYLEGPITLPSKQAAIREAGELLGFR